MTPLLEILHPALLILAAGNVLVASLHLSRGSWHRLPPAQRQAAVWGPLLSAACTAMILLADAAAPKLYAQLVWLPTVQVAYNAALAAIQTAAWLISARCLRAAPGQGG